MNNLISVIIPAYNAEQYIERCLESVVKQTYKNLEIIVVDDGSTDNTGDICEQYAKRDKRILVIHQQNKGLTRSRKVGITLSKGEYIGFVDSDDWIDEDMYEYLYQNMLKFDAQVVTSGRYLEFNGRSTKIPDSVKPGIYHPLNNKYFCQNMIYDEDDILWGITPNFWNKLFKKQHLIGFQQNVDDNITYGEDDACVYPCMAFAETVCVTEKCFYHYWRHEDSMSASSDDNYFTRINLLYISMKKSF